MENTEEKEFDLAVILTITTYKMFVTQKELGEAIKYITGDTVYTHTICSICERIQPYIFKRYPELKGVGVDYEGIGWDKVTPFINEMKEKYGATRKLGRITSKDGYVSVDPFVELENMWFKYQNEAKFDGRDCVLMKRDEDPLEGEKLEIVRRRKGE